MSAEQALQGRRICLVTSGNIGSNPRLVKEANALCAAGARVHVISLNRTDMPFVRERDRAVAEGRDWTWECVDLHARVWRFSLALLKRLARGACRYGLLRGRWVTCLALHPAIPLLARAASNWPADLYIAHNLPALPAAHMAASKHRAKLGFDAEDFHSGELTELPSEVLERELTQAIECQYLPRCQHVTAASPGIATAYANLCKINTPLVILNVFPLGEAPSSPELKGAQSPGPSLYWFSQTIGPHRGLEIAVQAIALTRCKPVLYIRGTPIREYDSKIRAQARKLGVLERLVILPPALPAEMLRLAAQYDLGIAGEVVSTINRDICLSNKVFTYLQAGVPVLLSDTLGQAAIARELGCAVRVYPQTDAEEMARCIDEFLEAPALLREARQTAWKLGQQLYNWEKESQKLLRAVSLLLKKPD